jgi:hypothetical protein
MSVSPVEAATARSKASAECDANVREQPILDWPSLVHAERLAIHSD